VEAVVARYGAGVPFGAMPAGGAEIPTFLSYAAERRLTKHPEEFGKGAIEGVAGPEAANNAAAAGVLVPRGVRRWRVRRPDGPPLAAGAQPDAPIGGGPDGPPM
jgi:hypothetical protein